MDLEKIMFAKTPVKISIILILFCAVVYGECASTQIGSATVLDIKAQYSESGGFYYTTTTPCSTTQSQLNNLSTLGYYYKFTINSAMNISMGLETSDADESDVDLILKSKTYTQLATGDPGNPITRNLQAGTYIIHEDPDGAETHSLWVIAFEGPLGDITNVEEGGACVYSGQCLSGHCVHDVCRPTDPYCGDDYCDTGEVCPGDCGAAENTTCSVDTDCASEHCVHDVCRPTDPYCGDDYCDANETTTCTADCWKAAGEPCTNSSYCSTGYCVHNICRTSDPYCGDNFCDANEESTCASDCANKITMWFSGQEYTEKIEFSAPSTETSIAAAIWAEVSSMYVTVSNTGKNTYLEINGNSTYLSDSFSTFTSSEFLSSLLSNFGISGTYQIKGTSLTGNKLTANGETNTSSGTEADITIDGNLVKGYVSSKKSFSGNSTTIAPSQLFNQQYILKISAAGNVSFSPQYNTEEGGFYVWSSAPASISMSGLGAIGSGPGIQIDMIWIILIVVIIIIVVVIIIVVWFLMHRKKKFPISG